MPSPRSTRARIGTLRRRRGPRLAAKLALDGFAFASAGVCAQLLCEGAPTGAVDVFATIVVARLAAELTAGKHTTSWRMWGLREAVRWFALGSGVSVAWLGARVALGDAMPVSYRVIVAEWLLSFAASAALRVGVRLVHERTRRARKNAPESPDHGRTLLIGAGQAGLVVAKELTAPDAECGPVVGFLDDDPTKQGQRVHGLPVLGTTADALRVVAEHDVDRVVLTLPSATRDQVSAIVDRLATARVRLETIPGLQDLARGRVHVSRIRPFQIEDLLGRRSVSVSAEQWQGLADHFAGRRVLVTGAGGSIGSELCRQLARLAPSALVLVDNHENNLFDIDREIRPVLGARTFTELVDVRDRRAIDEVMARTRPEIVFHAAAYKHVPMMEDHPCAAIDNNVRGTRTVAESAAAHGVTTFVMISTDKAVNPTNVMGASKRVAEMLVQRLHRQAETAFCCVRFGNVLGSRGSVIHTFRQQLERGGPITVTHPDTTRYFMTIPEAVQLVLRSTTMAAGGEIFILDMGRPVRVLDLARRMVHLAGLDENDVEIRFVGLRPGEKLHEELVRGDEVVAVDALDGVMQARPLVERRPEIQLLIRSLESAALEGNAAGVRRLLSMAGIGFAPETSEPVVPWTAPATPADHRVAS